MEKKKYLMLGVGRYRLSAIPSIQKWGGYAIAVDMDPSTEAFELADEGRVLGVSDEDGILRLAKETEVSAIIPMADSSVQVAAHVAELLGLPSGITYENALCASNKDLMRVRLRDHDVPIPSFAVCDNYDDFARAIRDYEFDCVIKPSDNSSGKGVKALDPSYGDVDLRTLYDETAAYSCSGIVLVEERVYGPEVSVESITVDGKTTVLTITDKYVSDPPYATEMGHSQPSALPDDVQEKIRSVTKATISAIGIENGPSHTEVKVTEQGPVVIEIGARIAADNIQSRLVPMSTGVDMIDASMQLVTGFKPNVEKTKNQGAAIRFITADSSGVIESIDIDDHIRNIDGFVEVELYAKPGDEMQIPSSNEWRIGHVLCSGVDGPSAFASATEALGFVSTVIRG